eukprot:433330_1
MLTKAVQMQNGIQKIHVLKYHLNQLYVMNVNVHDDFYTNDNGNDIYACECDHEEAVYNSPDTLQSIRCPETTPMPTSTPAPTGGCFMHQANICLFGMQQIVIHIVIVIQQMV